MPSKYILFKFLARLKIYVKIMRNTRIKTCFNCTFSTSTLAAPKTNVLYFQFNFKHKKDLSRHNKKHLFQISRDALEQNVLYQSGLIFFTLINFFPQACNWIFFIHFTRNYHYLEFDWLLVTASLKGTFTAWKVSKYRVFCGISPYSVQMRGNTDQKNSVFGHVSGSD